MTCSQMLAHCAEVQEVCNGSRSLDRTPALFKLLGPVVKKVVLLNRPFPRNSKTHPQYIITDSTDFEIEKRRLLASLHHFDSMTDDEHASVVHPVFGKMTRDEKGWLFYKHLDHHLTQFGV